MSYTLQTEIRDVENLPNVEYDETKTDVVFAEDHNSLKTAILELADEIPVLNKVVSATSYTTDTGTSLNVDNADVFIVTAQAGALKFNNPSGTPVQGQKLIIRIKDNGTARALTYDTKFRAMGNALPSTTVLSKTLYMGFIYNSTDTKWDLVAVAQES